MLRKIWVLLISFGFLYQVQAKDCATDNTNGCVIVVEEVTPPPYTTSYDTSQPSSSNGDVSSGSGADSGNGETPISSCSLALTAASSVGVSVWASRGSNGVPSIKVNQEMSDCVGYTINSSLEPTYSTYPNTVGQWICTSGSVSTVGKTVYYIPHTCGR